MAKTISKAFKKLVGIKKEEKKKSSKKKKRTNKHASKKTTKRGKKERLKEQRLKNLKRARKIRKQQIKKQREKEKRFKKIRLKSLRKAREERQRKLKQEKEKKKEIREQRLKNLKRARKIRKQEQGREKILEEAPEVVEEDYVSYEESIPELLKKAKFKELILKEKKIILKPNLTKCKAFPTTTEPHFVEEIIKYIKKANKKAKIIIAEGSGGSSTEKCYKRLGYEEMAQKYDIELVDLNSAKTIKRRSKKMKKFKTIEFPKVLTEGFLISLPVLKGHSKTKVTISLKNMIGCYPSYHYQTPGHTWKNKLHLGGVDTSIHDVLTVKFPDYAICDASIAQLEHEINGFPKEIGTLLAGQPLEVDKKGALLLGYDWKRIKHLTLAEELLED